MGSVVLPWGCTWPVSVPNINTELPLRRSWRFPAYTEGLWVCPGYHPAMSMAGGQLAQLPLGTAQH